MKIFTVTTSLIALFVCGYAMKILPRSLLLAALVVFAAGFGITEPALASHDTHILSFQSVSASSSNTCGVTTAGAAYCWGNNIVGQFGDGTTTSSNSPVAVSGGHTFKSVSAGGGHTCGVTTAGEAYCWGNNIYGRLGTGNNTPHTVPVAVLGGHTFKSVSAGGEHTCGVTTAGDVYCWGNNNNNQLGLGPTAPGSEPRLFASTPMMVSGGFTFKSLSLRNKTSCGVTTDPDVLLSGTVRCWGLVDQDSTYGASIPLLVSGGGNFDIFGSVSISGNHKCGINFLGIAFCWGANNHLQLGLGPKVPPLPYAYTPMMVSGFDTFKSVGAGLEHTCGVTTAGAALCWGDNSRGQLGGGGPNTPVGFDHVAVLGGHTFQSVSTGNRHTCGVTTAGAAYCWGYNFSGQLGNGTTTSSNVPVLVGADPDEDHDGVDDEIDLCMGTSSGESVDEIGCSDLQVDGDGDGFCNPTVPSGGPSACIGVDNCPFDPNSSQIDSDFDGYGDACDSVFNNDTAADQLIDDTDTSTNIIEDVHPPGTNGLVRKLDDVSSLVTNAVSDYNAGSITLADYVDELNHALSKLDAFDNQLNGKIANGQIQEPEASQLEELSGAFRSTTESLITFTN
jgi:alpha-tubulin suppressor-like RCC1 family protein